MWLLFIFQVALPVAIFEISRIWCFCSFFALSFYGHVFTKAKDCLLKCLTGNASSFFYFLFYYVLTKFYPLFVIYKHFFGLVHYNCIVEKSKLKCTSYFNMHFFFYFRCQQIKLLIIISSKILKTWSFRLQFKILHLFYVFLSPKLSYNSVWFQQLSQFNSFPARVTKPLIFHVNKLSQ